MKAHLTSDTEKKKVLSVQYIMVIMQSCKRMVQLVYKCITVALKGCCCFPPTKQEKINCITIHSCELCSTCIRVLNGPCPGACFYQICNMQVRFKSTFFEISQLYLHANTPVSFCSLTPRLQAGYLTIYSVFILTSLKLH